MSAERQLICLIHHIQIILSFIQQGHRCCTAFFSPDVKCLWRWCSSDLLGERALKADMCIKKPRVEDRHCVCHLDLWRTALTLQISVGTVQSCITAEIELLQSWVMPTNCCFYATWSVTSARGGGRKIEPPGRSSMRVFFCKGMFYFKVPSSAALWGVLQRCEDLRLSQETYVCKSWRDWRYSNSARRFWETATSKPKARMDAAPVQPTSALFWNKRWFRTQISALAKRPRLL